jgi:hypothetical protein
LEPDDWVRRRAAHSQRLMVTSSNEAAFGFWLRLGFQNTRGAQPYLNDEALVEHEMFIPPGRMQATKIAG